MDCFKKIIFAFLTLAMFNFTDGYCAKPIPSEDLTSVYNFRWIKQGIIAGMAMPDERTYEELCAMNIGLLVTLMPQENCYGEIDYNEKPAYYSDPLPAKDASIEHFHAPINPLMGIPTDEQTFAFLQALDKTLAQGKAVAAHCEYGRGRTGTMIACALIARFDMDAQSAIDFVRSKDTFGRRSIETHEQEEYIHHFERLFNDPIKHRAFDELHQFCWIKFEKIASMATQPTTREALASLKARGITHYIHLDTDKQLLGDKDFREYGITPVYLPLESNTRPQNEQLRIFFEQTATHRSVICGSEGRAGMLLTLWLMTGGYLYPDFYSTAEDLEQALSYLRSLKYQYLPENRYQERFLEEYQEGAPQKVIIRGCSPIRPFGFE